MNNDISSFDRSDWIDDLSEIHNQLNQSEKEEIEFLYKAYLQGESFCFFKKSLQTGKIQ